MVRSEIRALEIFRIFSKHYIFLKNKHILGLILKNHPKVILAVSWHCWKCGKKEDLAFAHKFKWYWQILIKNLKGIPTSVLQIFCVKRWRKGEPGQACRDLLGAVLCLS